MSAWCPTCEGNREINVCPASCDGSHVADYPRRCPDCAGTGRCGSCDMERPADELTQAYSFDFRPIEGRMWCRDKEACYAAWVGNMDLSPAARAAALGASRSEVIELNRASSLPAAKGHPEP